MRINNNLQSLNAWRQLTQTDSRLSRSLERLSSGMRINRAADDAAGLAVSEKMRAQIRSIDQAVRNAQDGISLIQTAEGALQEDSRIIQRLRELALQAANDTLTEEDRLQLQKEADELVGEFERIAQTTEFNTAQLLTGDFSAMKLQIGPNSGADYQLEISFAEMTSAAMGLVTTETTPAASATVDIGSGTDGTVTVTVDEAGAAGNDFTIEVVEASGDNDALDVSFADGKITVTLGKEGGNTDCDKNTATAIAAAIGGLADFSADASGTGATRITAAAAEQNFSGGAEEIEAGSLSIATQVDAQAAIDVLDNALNLISAERATMGAWQNRLEHTITNLGISSENLTAAESRIRDVDMAAEMMEFTRNQILIQSGTAMLAQANMKPQSVLQLLA